MLFAVKEVQWSAKQKYSEEIETKVGDFSYNFNHKYSTYRTRKV